jgi:outer membrane immunogenic protein
MRKVLGLVGATLLFTGPALAADLLKAPAMPLGGPVLSWTGWYIGATAGYGWSSDGGVDNFATSSFCNTGLNWCQPGGPPPSANLALLAAIPPHLSPDPKGFIGGGEIGYNYQVGQFVLGLEADFSGADIKGSDAQVGSSPVAGFASTVNVAATASEKLDFLATLRARFGFLLTPSFLVYGTAGGAFGHVSTTTTFSEAVASNCFCGPSPTVATTTSSTMPGWTAGGGLEWMFAPQWSLKGEYLYYNLGTLSTTSQITQTNGAGTNFFGAGVASNAFIKGSIARAGINFHF